MTSYCVIETKSGLVALAGTDGVITHSSLPKATRQEALAAIEAGLNEGGEEDVAAFGDLPGKLRRYFEGERVDFSSVPVDVSRRGPFHAAALRAAQKIPYGSIVTYRQLAGMAGSERAARAAGSAMAGNTVPIIVPCHRVLASGGSVGGFSLGLEWKRTLLTLEGVDV